MADDYSALYDAAGKRWNIDPNLLRAIAQQESKENPAAVSTANARGVFQFIPSTAAKYGLTDPHDTTMAAYSAAHYLSDLLAQNNGDVGRALVIYSGNQGDPARIPYVQSVLANYQALTKPQPKPAVVTPTATDSTPFDDIMTAKPSTSSAPAAPAAGSTPAPKTPFDELMAEPPPAQKPPTAAPPVPPQPPPTAQPPSAGPSPPPIYTAPTVPLIHPPAEPGQPDPRTEQMPAPGVGTPAPTGLTPSQENQLAGYEHGARTAFNPLVETATDVGSWVAQHIFGGQPSWMQTGDEQRQRDAANEAQFQAQYGPQGATPDPGAQGAAAATRFALPFAAGGLANWLLRAGLTAADLPAVANFLTGVAGQGMAGWRGLLTRLGSGATSGAVQGGIAGGAPGAAVGAGVGATVLPVAGKVADWLQARYGDAAVPAAQKIYQALVRDGMTPEAMDTAVQSLGVLGVPADVARANLRALASAVANSPGPAAETAATFLGARSAGQTTRLNEAVKTATGATGSAYDTLDALMTARAAEAAPRYEASFSRIVPTAEEAARVQPFISDPIGQDALQQGMRIIRLEKLAAREPFNPADYGVTQGADGKFTLNPGTPNLRLMDAVKRGYDDIVEGFRDPTTGRLVLNQYGRAVNAARAAYVGDLRDMYPRYGAALDAWAGPSQAMDAVSMGRRVLSTDPDVTAANVARMTPSMQEMYRIGVAETLKTQINKTPDTGDLVDATRRIFGNQDLRNKIAAGFGGADTDAFRNFQATVEREAAFANTARRTLSGSRTAPLGAAMADLNAPGPNLLEPAIHLATGNPLGAGASLARQAVNPFVSMLTAPSERVNESLGNMLFNPAYRQTLMENLTPGQLVSLRNRLTGWQAQQTAAILANRNRLTEGTQAP